MPPAAEQPPSSASAVDVGALLAGGSGSRAGVDKRYLVLGGRTLLQRNLGFLRELFPRVVVSVGAGQTVDPGDDAAVEIVADERPGASPLAGIATVLRRVGRPVFVLAVDLAFPSRDAADRVLAAFPGHDVALPVVGSHHEPLFAVYGPACLEPMSRLLEQRRHRITDAFPSLRVAHVPFPDAGVFHNINTMDSYHDAREQAGGGGSPALVAIVGKSDSGKTTLIEHLLPELRALGMRVGTVKHDAHGFDIDHPGKDSWRHGRAGAEAYAVASPDRFAFVARLEQELTLAEIARRYFSGFDVLVAEGYKRTAPHRVEIFRAGAGHAEPLCAAGEALALVTDTPLEHDHRFALGEARELARFLAARLDMLREY